MLERLLIGVVTAVGLALIVTQPKWGPAAWARRRLGNWCRRWWLKVLEAEGGPGAPSDPTDRYRWACTQTQDMWADHWANHLLGCPACLSVWFAAAAMALIEFAPERIALAVAIAAGSYTIAWALMEWSATLQSRRRVDALIGTEGRP